MKLAVRIFALAIVFACAAVGSFSPATTHATSTQLAATSGPRPAGLPVPFCGPGIPCD